MSEQSPHESGALFESAEWYDRTINWKARLAREIPVLMDVFGPPGGGGVIDAGCGTGRQAYALAQHGYRIVGVDASPEMLKVAGSHAQGASASVQFVQSQYAALADSVGDGFDGLYCLGNALASAGSAVAVAEALTQFARCLRKGGRCFIQILNFAPMRAEVPCVRGPRVCKVDGTEYISLRQFHFTGDRAQVTNMTIFHDTTWQQQAHAGTLYPLERPELESLCAAADLRIDDLWGGYSRDPFDVDRSADLILLATRV